MKKSEDRIVYPVGITLISYVVILLLGVGITGGLWMAAGPFWGLVAGIFCGGVFIVNANEDMQARNRRRQLGMKTQVALLEAAVGIPVVTQGTCRECGAELVAGAKFCSACRTPTALTAVVCPSCGTRNQEVAKWCAECGGPLRPPKWEKSIFLTR